MPQFPPRKSLSPRGYRSVARRVRELADAIDAHAEATRPREKATLSRTIAVLSQVTRSLWRQHNGFPVTRDLSDLSMSEVARKAGAAGTGDSKRRGDTEYYRRLAQRRHRSG